MSVSARRTASDRSSRGAKTSFEQGSVIGFKGAQAGVEQIAFGDDDDVEPGCDLVTTKNLSNQSFSSISLDRATELPGRRDPQPSDAALVRQDEHRAVAAVDPDAALVDVLEFGATANPFVRTESQSYSSLTVRRLRPFARRRLSTSRPFFELMRTRNPCVRLRWRVLG
jgi:hypothetical protein